MTYRVLITGARAPAALHMARLLDEAGHHVVMADSLRWPISAVSKACTAYVRLPAANGPLQAYAAAVRQALRVHDIDLVIPPCEEVFHLVRAWAQADMPARLYAPEFDLLAAAHNKYAFVQLAASLGLNVPQTWQLTGASDIAALTTPLDALVFKPVWSRFATRVLVRPSSVSIRPSAEAPWVAQHFVAGQEVCAYALAYDGRLVACAAYAPIYRAGTGAGIAFAPDHDPAVADFVRRFVEGTGWHGQLSFDFIRQHDGKIVAIECNPRATSGIHFFTSADDFASGLLSGQGCHPDIAYPLAVKLALASHGMGIKAHSVA